MFDFALDLPSLEPNASWIFALAAISYVLGRIVFPNRGRRSGDSSSGWWSGSDGDGGDGGGD